MRGAPVSTATDPVEVDGIARTIVTSPVNGAVFSEISFTFSDGTSLRAHRGADRGYRLDSGDGWQHVLTLVALGHVEERHHGPATYGHVTYSLPWADARYTREAF